MSSTANAASGGQIRSGLRALGESLRRGRRKVCPVLGLIEIETASKSLFSLSVQNVSVCAKSNVGTLVIAKCLYSVFMPPYPHVDIWAHSLILVPGATRAQSPCE